MDVARGLCVRRAAFAALIFFQFSAPLASADIAHLCFGGRAHFHGTGSKKTLAVPFTLLFKDYIKIVLFIIFFSGQMSFDEQKKNARFASKKIHR